MATEWIQLEFFPLPPDQRNLQEIKKLRSDLDKQRKSLHAKIGKVNKTVLELHDEIELLKSAICYGEKIKPKQEQFAFTLERI